LNSDQIEVKNYSAHAMEDLRKFACNVQDYAPVSAGVLQRVVHMLEHSVKFLLPNCCDIFDPHETRQAHHDLVRLPYPCVAFEAPWEKEGGSLQLGEFEQWPATKRIALCWEPHPQYELLPGLNSVVNAFPAGGVFVLPIYWGPKFPHWMVSLGGIFYPYGNVFEERSIEDAPPASRIANAALTEAGRAASTKHYRSEPFYILPEYFDMTVQQRGSREKAYAQIMLDAADETTMLVQACSMLHCANVTTAEIAPSTALNKSRQAKGKQPFFTYKVLQLSDHRLVNGDNGAHAGHARPRMHLRRGHLRRLPNKVIWVRPAMINTSSQDGIVVKDYAVPGRRMD
jgi:hypothetical protein